MVGVFYGIGEGDCSINVGILGLGVVKRVLEEKKDVLIDEIYEIIKKMVFKIIRAGQFVLQYVSKKFKILVGIVDLFLVLILKVGDSIVEIFEEIGVEKVGGYGIIFVLVFLNDVVKKGGVMAVSFIGGFLGVFIFVLEDFGMVRVVEVGVLLIEKFEVMISVCFVGFDMIVVLGDVEVEVIFVMIVDEIVIGVYNNKIIVVCVIFVYGKKEGDEVNFGGFLGGLKVMKINRSLLKRLIECGGRVLLFIILFRN